MSRHSLARRERHQLCDLGLELGPDARTLCGDWDARHLFAHLRVREHQPLGSAGLLVPPLSGLTERAMTRTAARDFTALVASVREPGFTPYALPPVEKLANTLEYVVHHEDLRRAQPGWEPRALDPHDLDLVWSSIARMGRLLVRPAGVPVVIRRNDTGETRTLRGGDPAATVTGPVVEIVMFLFGRDEARDLTFTGPDDLVPRLTSASLGL